MDTFIKLPYGKKSKACLAHLNLKGGRIMKKLLLIGLALLLLAGACAPTSPTLSPEIQRLMEQELQELLRPKVTIYKVFGKGTTKASLTFETPDGTSQQDVRLPWQQSYTFAPGSFVYLSAQNQSDSGCITAQIVVEGKTWKEVESCGAYVIASVSGSID